jgi:hypothetical protein
LGCENIGGCDMVQNEHFYTTHILLFFLTKHHSFFLLSGKIGLLYGTAIESILFLLGIVPLINYLVFLR